MQGKLFAQQSQRDPPEWELNFEPGALGHFDSLWDLEEGSNDRALPSQEADWETDRIPPPPLAVWEDAAEEEQIWDWDMQQAWFGLEPEDPEEHLDQPGNRTPRDLCLEIGLWQIVALQAGKG